MRVRDAEYLPLPLVLTVCLLLLPQTLAGQANYQAQIRGVVADSTGAVLPNASVTITEVGTNVTQRATTGRAGEYILRALRPSTYVVNVGAAGFQTVERKGVVLAVDQEASLNFTLRPAGTSTQVQVTEAAPLLDTGSSSLGTDITSEYVKEIPLLNRNFFGLVFLTAGVSETAGSGTADNYPSGTNFVSNGQRNATAEVRVDGALITAPEEGEGGNSNIFYEPSVEAVQEFKVQNNAFSAEFGSNGGTVVNMALKSGTNALHGSAWWFGQRGAFDANDFFSNQAGLPKPDHSRNQYGFSLGGPVRKNKTFFFLDMERVLETDPINIVGTVPTPEERKGDFSQALITDPNSGNVVPNLIFNPFSLDSSGNRNPFTGNTIPQNLWDSVGENLLNLYPLPNQPGNPDGTNNFRTNTNNTSKGLQFDVKLDQQVSNKTHLAGRYSHAHSSSAAPTILGDGEFNDGNNYVTSVNNGGLQFDWTLRPTLLLSSRFAIEHVHAPGFTTYPSAASAGFPTLLDNANPGISRMPAILVDSPWTSIYDQCCVDTKLDHTLYSFSSSLAWAKGKHSIKFGGEQRIFFNNFQEPNYASGYFHFAQTVTENIIGNFDPTQGNPFADILLGIGDYGGIGVDPMALNKSKDTSFYVQDDFRVTPKLTLNLGLRYEWSTPYTERFNHTEFSDFTSSSGVTVDLSSGDPGLQALGLGPTQLKGITRFPTSSQRNVPVDRNNWALRLGFAYQLTPDTVVRGGAGVYYGMNVATNYQYVGTAFRKDGVVYFTKATFKPSMQPWRIHFPPVSRRHRGKNTVHSRCGDSAMLTISALPRREMLRSINGAWVCSVCFPVRWWSPQTTQPIAARIFLGAAPPVLPPATEITYLPRSGVSSTSRATATRMEPSTSVSCTATTICTVMSPTLSIPCSRARMQSSTSPILSTTTRRSPSLISCGLTPNLMAPLRGCPSSEPSLSTTHCRFGFRNAPATTSVSRAATPSPSRRTTRLLAETPGWEVWLLTIRKNWTT
jgi:hypothetical protein